jgi:hypothetical protein
MKNYNKIHFKTYLGKIRVLVFSGIILKKSDRVWQKLATCNFVIIFHLIFMTKGNSPIEYPSYCHAEILHSVFNEAASNSNLSVKWPHGEKY